MPEGYPRGLKVPQDKRFSCVRQVQQIGGHGRLLAKRGGAGVRLHFSALFFTFLHFFAPVFRRARRDAPITAGGGRVPRQRSLIIYPVPFPPVRFLPIPRFFVRCL